MSDPNFIGPVALREITISGTAGATVNAPTATSVVTANGTYTLTKAAANTWDLAWSN